MIVWRISKFASLDGLGGTKIDGRWHSAGRPIVYTAEHPALALCEMLVHFNAEDMPVKFQLLQIEISDDPAKFLSTQLPENWFRMPEYTQWLGDQWLAGNQSSVLQVPSALLPNTFNYLLNPARENHKFCKIIDVLQVPLDPRFR